MSTHGHFALNYSPDLSGSVIKTAPHCIAYGGNSDIWKGQWLKKDSGHIVEVRLRLGTRPPLQLNLPPLCCLQVAVKVLKAPEKQHSLIVR
jgi:hypothetical protein